MYLISDSAVCFVLCLATKVPKKKPKKTPKKQNNQKKPDQLEYSQLFQSFQSLISLKEQSCVGM